MLPLGYSDAEEILKRMAGPAVPSEWQGGMNVTYRIGPGFVQDQGNRLRVEVHSKSEIRWKELWPWAICDDLCIEVGANRIKNAIFECYEC